MLQPPVLGRPVRADGHPARSGRGCLLRAEGGGHGRRRPEPAHALDRHDHPVQARQERPARGDPAGRHGHRGRRGRGDRGGGADRRGRERRSCRSTTGRRTSPCGRACRSCPIAINGTSWLRFGGRVRVRVGEPIASDRARPTGPAVAAHDRRPWRASRRRSSPTRPARVRPGRVGRWVTRAVQRLAGGLARGGPRGAGRARSEPPSTAATEAACPPAADRTGLAYSGRRPDARRRHRGSDRTVGRPEGVPRPASPSRPTSRSTPGPPS